MSTIKKLKRQYLLELHRTQGKLLLLYTLVKLAKSHYFLLSFVCILYTVFVCLNCLFVFLTFCYHLWWIKIFIIIIIIIIFKPSKKTRVGKKLKKLRKNGEANVPSSRPAQNCCGTKQNWNETTKQKGVENKTWFPCRLQTRAKSSDRGRPAGPGTCGRHSLLLLFPCFVYMPPDFCSARKR